MQHLHDIRQFVLLRNINNVGRHAMQYNDHFGVRFDPILIIQIVHIVNSIVKINIVKNYVNRI